MSNGLVSIKQIFSLVKELKLGFPTGNKYQGKKMVYTTSRNHGLVKILDESVKVGKDLFVGDEFDALLKGFYHKQANGVKNADLEDYLSTMLNKKVALLSLILNPKISFSAIYNQLQYFKHVYNQVSRLTPHVVFHFNEYEFTPKEKKYAKETIHELLKGVANDYHLTLTVLNNKVEPDCISYGIQIDSGLVRKPATLSYLMLAAQFAGDDIRFLEVAETLYNLSREQFTREYITSLLDGKEDEDLFEKYRKFIRLLTHKALTTNIEGLLDWYDYANALQEDKETLTNYVKGTE